MRLNELVCADLRVWLNIHSKIHFCENIEKYILFVFFAGGSRGGSSSSSVGTISSWINYILIFDQYLSFLFLFVFLIIAEL